MQKKNTLESYIVRVYRRGEGDSPDFVGIVEAPGTPGTKTFHTTDELLAIIEGRREAAVSGVKGERVRNREKGRRVAKPGSGE